MLKFGKPNPMKDFINSDEDSTQAHSERMLPTQGNFTRPRRFGPSGSKTPKGTNMPRGNNMIVDDQGAMVTLPDNKYLKSHDLWGLLNEQKPGLDQHILEGSQAAYDFRGTDVSRAFDQLRTRLRQTMKQHAWVNIGVVAPTAGCGTTFTAANLAASLARVPSSRTVLMDLNLRNPKLATTLNLDASQTADLRDFLAGDVAITDYILRVSDTLAVGLAAFAQTDAAEIMQDPATAESLKEMSAALRPDAVIYDLPPLLPNDDTTAFLPQLDGVLLVSDGTQTMAKHIAECTRMLGDNVPLLGIILNRARASSIERY